MTRHVPHVRIWRQPDGLWRWCYTEPDQDGTAELTLVSHRAYDTHDEARSTALAAYPGIDLQEIHPHETPPRSPAQRPRTQPTPSTQTRSRGHALWLVLVALVLFHLARRRWRARGARRLPRA